MLDLRDSEQDLFRNLETPEQISIMSASYFTKQLRMFTDASITQKLLDDVFKLFMVNNTLCKQQSVFWLLLPRFIVFINIHDTIKICGIRAFYANEVNLMKIETKEKRNVYNYIVLS